MKVLSRAAAFIAVCVALGGASDGRSPDFARSSVTQAPNLRVHSDLVVLHVAVMNREFRFVPGLLERQFRIYEDEVPQSISFFSHEDQPATVGLVIDNSGSMLNKRADVIAAAQAFARASTPHDELFIVNFNEQVWLGLPPAISFTNDTGVLLSALSNTRARGQTALYDAVSSALDRLKLAANRRRVLVVISDGGDNASSTGFDALLQHARRADSVIYSMGLFDESMHDGNRAVLKQLAAATGGETFLPGSAHDASHILERIGQDIRNTYTIGYVPTDSAHDGRYRSVRVTVDARDQGRLTVRSRTGYVAPS